MFVIRSCFVLFLMVSVAQAAEIHLLNNTKLQGQLMSIDSKGVEFKVTGGSEKTFKHSEIVTIDLGTTKNDLGSAKYIDVELTDGTTIHCTDFKVKGSTALLTLFAADGKGRVLELPTTSISTMLRESQDTFNNLKFKALLGNLRAQRRDIYIFSKGEGTERKLTGLTGTFGEGTLDPEQGNKLKFTDDKGKESSLFQNNIHGMAFNQIPGANPPETICKVIDTSKNIFYAQSVSFRDNKVMVKTVGGVEVAFPSLETIAKFDFSTSALKYLSELPPTAIVRTDTSEAPFSAPKFDRNLDDEKLKVNGTTYEKGVAIHSGYALSWTINGDYRVLKGVLGVDDYFDIPSAVKVIIEGDGRELLKRVVKKKDKPFEVNLDVTNVKVLRVVVQSNDPNGFDSENQVNFVDAKVTK